MPAHNADQTALNLRFHERKRYSQFEQNPYQCLLNIFQHISAKLSQHETFLSMGRNYQKHLLLTYFIYNNAEKGLILAKGMVSWLICLPTDWRLTIKLCTVDRSVIGVGTMGPNPTLITGWRQGVAGSQIPLNSVPFFSNLNVFNPISQSQSKIIFSILKNIFLVNLVPFAQISMF